MSRQLQGLLTLGLIAVSPFLCLADSITSGAELYRLGKIEAAKASFQKALQKDFYNAENHYQLANCLTAQKNYLAALAEYRKALELSEDPQLTSFCRMAIERLTPLTEQRILPKAISPSEQVLSTAAFQAKAKMVTDIIERSQANAKAILGKAEELCKPLLEEKRTVMQTMAIKYRGRVETTTEAERSEVEHDYDQKLENIRSLAKRHSQEVLDQGKRDAASVGQGLPNLEDLLDSK
jgi:tetratricopeptide (TPR) repeat protein